MSVPASIRAAADAGLQQRSNARHAEIDALERQERHEQRGLAPADEARDALALAGLALRPHEQIRRYVRVALLVVGVGVVAGVLVHPPAVAHAHPGVSRRSSRRSRWRAGFGTPAGGRCRGRAERSGRRRWPSPARARAPTSCCRARRSPPSCRRAWRRPRWSGRRSSRCGGAADRRPRSVWTARRSRCRPDRQRGDSVGAPVSAAGGAGAGRVISIVMHPAWPDRSIPDSPPPPGSDRGLALPFRSLRSMPIRGGPRDLGGSGGVGGRVDGGKRTIAAFVI